MKKHVKHKYHRKKEFRFHEVKVINKSGKAKSIRHPCFIFLEKGNLFIYVQLTHSENVKDYVVVKLRKNPNPNDERISYYIEKVMIDNKVNFDKRLSNWEINIDDDSDIRELIKKR